MLGSKYNHSTFLEILVAKNTWSGAQDQISSLANDQMTSRGMADLKTWKKVSIEVTLLKIASLLNKKIRLRTMQQLWLVKKERGSYTNWKVMGSIPGFPNLYGDCVWIDEWGLY